MDERWRLTPEHELHLGVREAGSRWRWRHLNATLTSTSAHALTVTLQQRGHDGRLTSQRVALSGRWQADRRNRLTFLAARADGAVDRLTLAGAWEVDGQELRYQYARQDRAGRIVGRHALTFAGSWELVHATRLAYRLEGATDSAFVFRAAVRTPSLRARDGRIVYGVGVELSQRRQVHRRVTLFGIWKLHRDLSVSFEASRPRGRRLSLRFQGTVALTTRDAVTLALWDLDRRALGLSVAFERRWFKDAEWFLRLQRAGDEAEVMAGVRVRF